MDHERQKVEVVGDPSSNASAGRRMPPVLDVAFLELPRRRPKDVRPRLGRIAVNESQDVLKLVAEPVCAAGLVESRASPKSARKNLIEEPAILHDVHAGIRRRNLNTLEDSVPMRNGSLQCGLDMGWIGIGACQ